MKQQRFNVIAPANELISGERIAIVATRQDPRAELIGDCDDVIAIRAEIGASGRAELIGDCDDVMAPTRAGTG